MTCKAYYKNERGDLVPCPRNPLRNITYQDQSGECTSGEYCDRHAIELRRDECQGRLEILTDEPVAIPFQGEPMPNREIDTKSYYGV